MKVKIDAHTGELYLDVTELSAFARTRVGASPAAGFRRSPGDGGQGDAEGDVRREVTLSVTRAVGGVPCHIGAVADAVSFDGTTLSCEMRRPVRRKPEYVSPGEDVVYLAQAMSTAYMLAENEGLHSVALRICFYRDREAQCWEAMFARAVLERAFEALLSRAAPFIEIEARRQREGRSALAKLKFPYRAVREGQKELMETLYRCIRSGRRLMASAPTGIGKTVSGVYPALRSIGSGAADRIFYFTAKTVTGNAALDAIRAMADQAPELRAIRLTAKERICPRRRGGEGERGMCRHCPNVSAREGISYEQRRDQALQAALEAGCVLDAPLIDKLAAEYGICPYELSLDASEYCEMIVCDYGYLLDGAVRLRRYFAEPRGEQYVFLFDEAHNLPDRAREIYSAALNRQEFEAFAAEACAALPDDQPLHDACEGMRAMFDAVDGLCAENAEMEDGESRGGFYLSREIPTLCTDAVGRMRAITGEYLRRDYGNAAPLFEDIHRALRRFADAVAFADDAFSFYAEAVGDQTRCRIMCLDPAALLSEAMKHARCTALFSATLSPMDYYADVCGCSDAVKLDLPSPYERDNLCLITVDSVSTRFSQRKNSAAEVAELIETVTEARVGNYIVYFPSYKYMEAVCRHFLRLSPSMPVIMQKQGMSLRDRDRFLRAFERGEESGEGVVAFCVLGGIFSEGIDLRGERLIGTVIVGIGLPGLSSELNILSEYYERTRESGRDYAYLYPAMNKILQAAGRVIRAEEDRGAVVLIDDRYRDPGVRRLFPAHWNRMQYTGDPYTLGVVLERFWDAGEE